jgi:predicted nucleic acid-binding protein
MIVVSNTSPITNLAAIRQLNLLQQLYNTIIIPQAVYDEMAALDYPVPGSIEVQTLSWITTQQVRSSFTC